MSFLLHQLLLRIILLKDDPSLGQVMQVGGEDGGVVPGDIIVAKVICQNQDYVWLAGSLSGHGGGQQQQEEHQFWEKGQNHHGGM